jgi:secreted trypsin-like serine protease
LNYFHKKHQNFSRQTLINDIGIIKLAERVTLNHRIQIACLPFDKPVGYPAQTTATIKSSNNISAASVYAVGWGRTSDEPDGPASRRLKNVRLLAYPFAMCNRTSGIENAGMQMCVGDLANRQDTCAGDSGGSLYKYDVSDSSGGGLLKPIVVGIVSYGIGCATPDLPA